MQFNDEPSTGTSVESRIPEPQSIPDTGLTLGFLADLALKLVYYQDDLNSLEIAEALTLPFYGVIERVLEFLKREQLVEISGTNGLGEQGFQWAISRKGRERAVEALTRDQYSGPAPVPLERYNEMVLRQSMGDLLVRPDEVREALAHLVIRPEVIDRLGPAVNSGRSLFLYGPSGNGKTAIGKSIIRMLGGSVYIPYTVIVDGHIIRLFDEVNHQRFEDPPVDGRLRNAAAREAGRTDPRWVKIRRPEISVGGELTMPSLDLIFDPVSKTYEAPFQMKANTGLFVIDDFGRQAMPPQNLLNRWIVPLELRVDFLTLHTGKKIEIPFDQLIVFSTNLDPRDLV
ncbi:ATP-binding protein, partial [Chloroflexota bacterium]